MKREAMVRPVMMCHSKTAEECEALKAASLAAATVDVDYLSTNDCVMAELATSLELETEKVPISMIYNFRSEVGGEAVFGNM